MHAFQVQEEQVFDPRHHIPKVLARIEKGDVTLACWEPGQVSPYHCHPEATEIYFCFEGGGTMKNLEQTIDIMPGGAVIFPPGEYHEYTNGPQRTLLFRIRYGENMASKNLNAM